MMGTVYCELEIRKVEPKAWIATEKALEDQADSKGDGMCRGTFKVHVDVTEENGNMDSKHFVIKVPDDWHWPSLSVDIKNNFIIQQGFNTSRNSPGVGCRSINSKQGSTIYQTRSKKEDRKIS
jgi:hypothetical protein